MPLKSIGQIAELANKLIPNNPENSKQVKKTLWALPRTQKVMLHELLQSENHAIRVFKENYQTALECLEDLSFVTRRTEEGKGIKWILEIEIAKLIMGDRKLWRNIAEIWESERDCLLVIEEKSICEFTEEC